MRRITLIAATRGSALAIAQTQQVIAALDRQGIECRELIVRTEGDTDRKTPLVKMGGRGVFVSAAEDAVLEGRADIAVHSAKDMPSRLRPQLCIAAALKRADPRDILVTRKGYKLGPGDTVGTGSPRRTSQLGGGYRYAPLRGNIETRLAAVEEGRCCALVTAAAAIGRLGLFDDADFCARFDVRFLSPEEMVPAAGQGIIAVECLSSSPLRELLGKISDSDTYACLQAERAFMAEMNAGCHESAGAYAQIREGHVHIRGYWRGKCGRAEAAEPEEAGRKLARVLR